ncbi:MAG: EamA family transporter RarD [Paracoccaceae bacterium]
MREPLKGVLAMVLACSIWGLSSIYYKQLAHVPPFEVLSHRTIWSFVFFGLVLLLQRRLSDIFRIVKAPRTLGFLALSAVMISINWFVFIYAIQIGRAMEASFGYYIFPIVAVAIGVIALKERLSPAQFLAISIAFIAVVILGIGLGNPPWISLILALTFGVYGLIKKQIAVGPVLSVLIEVLILLPIAAFWLFGVHNFGWSITGLAGGVFASNWQDSALLMFSGILTGGPLILLSYAAKRITLTTLGLVQYLNPTLQFLVATFVFAENFTRWHAIAFPLIWIGLAIYSADTWRQGKSGAKDSALV